MGWLDEVPASGAGMHFAHGAEVTCERPAMVPSPYNRDTLVEDWENATTHQIRGAFIDTDGTGEASDPVRSRAETRARLIVADPAADVKRGDRIRDGEKLWTVEGFPESDKNPFTGWQPVLICNLTEEVG